MSEKISNPLTPYNSIQGRQFSVGAGPDFLMRGAPACTRLSLRIEGEHLKKADTAFGQIIPLKIGAMSQENQKYALCLGPDEWLLLTPSDMYEGIVAQFSKLNPDIAHSLVDVSQRTVGIEILGPKATLALNAGCPLDLHNMKVGSCARTVFDSCEIILLKLDKQRYRLEIVRSFAPFIWSFLEKVGGELGAWH